MLTSILFLLHNSVPISTKNPPGYTPECNKLILKFRNFLEVAPKPSWKSLNFYKFLSLMVCSPHLFWAGAAPAFRHFEQWKHVVKSCWSLHENFGFSSNYGPRMWWLSFFALHSNLGGNSTSAEVMTFEVPVLFLHSENMETLNYGIICW